MLRAITYATVFVIACAVLFAERTRAQESTSPYGNVLGARSLPGENGFNAVVETSSVEIYLRQQSGAPIEGVAMVSLINLAGQVYRQATTKEGHLTFNGVAPTEYTIQVVSPVYERVLKQVEAPSNAPAQVTIVLHVGEGVDIGAALSLSALKPKAQKEVAKAIEALRANRPDVARDQLEAVSREVPNHPEVSYLRGVYASQLKDWAKAKSEWSHTVELNPKHVRALLSLGELSIREKKSKEAIDYAKRAIEADSSSWRAHAILAEAHTLEGAVEQTVEEAERARELAHGQNTMVEPMLAQALAKQGERKRATEILEDYVQKYPKEAAAKKQLEALEALENGTAGNVHTPTPEELTAAAVSEMVLATMGRSAWMPPDIDENVPQVEAGPVCAVDEVVQQAGKRLQEFIATVDRFTATESVVHETIDKWGTPSTSERAQFEYLVSIEEAHRGLLQVEEYRERKNSTGEFPEAVTTNGLPALVLVFHPYYAGNYEMSCEGLARWNGTLAWQVHFRQRKDKPNTIRSYRIGLEGQSYPVALKGRAWITADTYQIVRQETDLVAPLPQIRLAADHIAIEYGPVHFHSGPEMWVPQKVESYYEWKGRRVHRRHNFSNYLLFSVDDKQRISVPKVAEPETPAATGEVAKPDL